MVPSLLKGIGITLLLPLSYQSVSASATTCLASKSSGSDCLYEYHAKSNEAHQSNPNYVAPDKEYSDALNDYLDGLSDPAGYQWFDFWYSQKQNLDAAIYIQYCFAIEPIIDFPADSCLCPLNSACTNICDQEIEDMFYDETTFYFDPFPTDLVTKEDCQKVLDQINSKNYDELCGEKQAYKDIYQCANGTPSPNSTPAPTASADATAQPISTPSPITITTKKQDTPSPTDQVSDTSAPTKAVVTTPSPIDTASTSPPSTSITNTVSTESTHSNPQQTANTSSNLVDQLQAGNDTDTNSYDYGPYDWGYETTLNVSKSEEELDTAENLPPSTTIDLYASSDSHPFANLLLVSLIILGFCVFVAWYAKKNQIPPDHKPDDDDNGYLWGLNNKSSPSSSDPHLGGDSQFNPMASNKGKKGRSRHKQLLSQFDDDELLDQEMNIQMTHTHHNNDLLAITPDHVGRLQTRTAPNQLAPNVPHHAKRQKRSKRTKRRGKGGKFQQLADDDDPDMDDYNEEESDSSSSGEDMMKMRDQYMASQTFSKKLADTLGDIQDTVKVTAAAMKDKLTKKEPAVVRPMQMGRNKDGKSMSSKKKDKMTKRQRFTMVEDNETTDGFDLDSSNSTQEDEYREDSETEVRVNIHGRKIKQPMKLPTKDSSDDMEMENEREVNDVKKSKKRKKKKDKKKKKKKDKRSKVENVEKVKQIEDVHEIDVRMNNDDTNMGFGTDELAEDDDHIELGKGDNIELTKEEETMTLNDLEKELMNAGKSGVDGNINNEVNVGNGNNVDLSFMDDVVGGDSNHNNNNTQSEQVIDVNDMDLEHTADEVAGNGNAPHEETLDID